jgi:hypothetical protein
MELFDEFTDVQLESLCGGGKNVLGTLASSGFSVPVAVDFFKEFSPTGGAGPIISENAKGTKGFRILD